MTDSPTNPDAPKPITLRTLQKMVERGERFSMLTAYDATTARWLGRAGVEVLLVGDTAAEMILGYDSTIHAPLPFMIEITAAVKRGAPHCLVMGDMPFMSYQESEPKAIRNAGRFLTRGKADLVKLEVDGSHDTLVRALCRAGIPVVAHLGSRPQQVRRTGGYRAVGRTADQAKLVLEESQKMIDAGAVMLLLEAVPADVGERVAKLGAESGVPVVGCGAGDRCHGKVVVLHDLLGLTDWQPPFAKPAAAVGQAIVDAAVQWVSQVKAGPGNGGQDTYEMSAEERKKFTGDA
jgi:3-methyl-2-oxobutanoate hydroxymethyltransferase